MPGEESEADRILNCHYQRHYSMRDAFAADGHIDEREQSILAEDLRNLGDHEQYNGGIRRALWHLRHGNQQYSPHVKKQLNALDALKANANAKAPGGNQGQEKKVG